MTPIPVTVAVLFAASFGALAQKAPDKKIPAETVPAKPAGPQIVTPDAAEALMKSRQDLIVLDVRTPEEFEMSHIAGAKNASVIDLEFDAKLKELEGKPVLVHCTAGTRSGRAVQQMAKSGKFPEIYHMNGGITAWSEAGKTVVRIPKAPK
jgi:rhodanese-related sulfurtransferase